MAWKNSREPLRIARHDVGEAVHLGRVGEEQPEHAADVIRGQPDAERSRALAQAFDEASGHLRQAAVKPVLADDLQGGQPGRHRNRVARERTGLIHGSVRSDMVHDLAAAAECADRHAATDDLAEDGSGPGAPRRVPGRRRARPGNPVITSSNTSTAPCSSQHSRSDSRNPGTGGTQFMFPATGSTITAAIRSPNRAKRLARALRVVESQRQRVLGKPRGNAGRGRHAEGERTRTRLDEQRVRMPVVAAFELHDCIPSGESPGEPDGAQRSLGARADHAHLVPSKGRGRTRAPPSPSRARSVCRSSGPARPPREPPRLPGGGHARPPPAPHVPT